MPSSPSLDYRQLAELLDQAANEHRQLGATSSDPVARYQFRVSVDFFTAARNAAQDYLRQTDRQAINGQPHRNRSIRRVDAR